MGMVEGMPKKEFVDLVGAIVRLEEMLVSPLQFRNAELPMEETELGKVIVVKLVQY